MKANNTSYMMNPKQQACVCIPPCVKHEPMIKVLYSLGVVSIFISDDVGLPLLGIFRAREQKSWMQSPVCLSIQWKEIMTENG